MTNQEIKDIYEIVGSLESTVVLSIFDQILASAPETLFDAELNKSLKSYIQKSLDIIHPY